MKKIKIIFMTMVVCMFGIQAIAQTAPSGTITYQKFYDELKPYGAWINYPGYGEVWHPNVADFKPYATNGYWENTDQRWYWESEYDWGWGPFHYGNWFYDDAYGWLWEPGYEWSPAWVTWGDLDDAYAWAPVPPAGIAAGENRPHNYYWNVVDRKNIYNRDLNNHLADESRLRRDADKIKVGRAPVLTEVGRHTGQTIPTHRITEVNEPVRNVGTNTSARRAVNNELPVYKPTIQRPQTAETRRPDMQRVTPMRANDAWPTANREVQRTNIERTQMHQPAMHREMPGRRN